MPLAVTPKLRIDYGRIVVHVLALVPLARVRIAGPLLEAVNRLVGAESSPTLCTPENGFLTHPGALG